MKFAILAIALVLLAGFFHMIFIMFDYGFNDPDTGGFSLMRERLNESMNPYYRNWAYNNSVALQQFFGIGRFICIALCPVLIAVEIFSRKMRVEAE